MRKKNLFGRALSLSLALAMAFPANSVAAKEVVKNSGLNITTNANNGVKTIKGKLANKEVTSIKDARDIIENIAEKLGVNDTDTEIKYINSATTLFTTSYNFRQYYKGLEVINSCISVVVDKETGIADYLTSSFVTDLSVDVNPTVSKEDAKKTAEDALEEKVSGNVALVVYKAGNAEKLAWRVSADVKGFQKAYVDAKTGEIIGVVNSCQKDQYDDFVPCKINVKKDNFSIGEREKVFRDDDYEVDITTYKGNYVMYDKGRNICFVNQGGGRDPHYAPSNSDPRKLYSHLAVMHNVEKAYDFYKSLGYTFKNKSGEDVILQICGDYKYEGKQECANAFSLATGDRYIWLAFGVGDSTRGNYGAEIDIATHELTHAITRFIVGWEQIELKFQDFVSNQGQLFGLGEAYGDIMGELNDDTREWQHGTDQYFANTNTNTSEKKVYCNRDLSNPEHKIFTDYDEVEALECHDSCTIVSYAAYLMDKYGVPVEDMKKIWFESLNYLPHNTNDVDFIDCKEAVIEAAETYYESKDEATKISNVSKIKRAFYYVHLWENPQSVGDFNLDGVVNVQDVNDLTLYLQNNASASSTQLVNADVNFDGQVNEDDKAILTTIGDMNLDGVVDEEDYELFKEAYREDFNSEKWLNLQKCHADINQDGIVDISDYTAFRYLVK